MKWFITTLLVQSVAPGPGPGAPPGAPGPAPGSGSGSGSGSPAGSGPGPGSGGGGSVARGRGVGCCAGIWGTSGAVGVLGVGAWLFGRAGDAEGRAGGSGRVVGSSVAGAATVGEGMP